MLSVYYCKYQRQSYFLSKTIKNPYRNYDNVVKKHIRILQIKVLKNILEFIIVVSSIYLTYNYVVQAGEAAGGPLVFNININFIMCY